jgi:hypothetical protein
VSEKERSNGGGRMEEKEKKIGEEKERKAIAVVLSCAI